jgi:drug/metabolite transporter (DMT)-like permease
VKTYLLILVPILLIAVGQTSAKHGAVLIGEGAPVWNAFILLGYAILIVRGLVWVLILKNLKLSFAYPFISLSYIVVLAVSHRFFGEAVTSRHLLGTALIVAGVFGIWLGQRRLEGGGRA